MSLNVMDDDFLVVPIIMVVCLAILVLGLTVVNDSTNYIQLKADIPNMDCRELVMIHNKYDYWLDGEKDTTLFQREDLFDLWYNRIVELRCVNP